MVTRRRVLKGLAFLAAGVVAGCIDSSGDDLQQTPNPYDLADYPLMFIDYSNFNGRIVVGSTAPSSDVVAAVDITTSLQYQTVQTEDGEIVLGQLPVGTVALDIEISSLEQNLILIGMPSSATGSPNTLIDNYALPPLSEGEGLLKIVNHNDCAHLIVSGYSSADVRKAAKVLANYKDHNLSGSEVFIVGDLTNPTIRE